MAFHYELVTEPILSELFRQSFLRRMRETGCCEMFRLVESDAPSIWEFRRGKDIFTLSLTPDAGERKERIVIESETLDLSDVIVATIQRGLSDYLTQFLSPLAKIPKAELEGKIKACLEGLQSLAATCSTEGKT